MIRFLSDLGRSFVVLGAVVFVFISTYEAYLYQDDAISIGIGFLGGCILSGFLFGIVATLYDIRDNLRLLVEQGETPEIIPVRPDPKPDEVNDLRAL